MEMKRARSNNPPHTMGVEKSLDREQEEEDILKGEKGKKKMFACWS